MLLTSVLNASNHSAYSMINALDKPMQQIGLCISNPEQISRLL